MNVCRGQRASVQVGNSTHCRETEREDKGVEGTELHGQTEVSSERGGQTLTRNLIFWLASVDHAEV